MHFEPLVEQIGCARASKVLVPIDKNEHELDQKALREEVEQHVQFVVACSKALVHECGVELEVFDANFSGIAVVSVDVVYSQALQAH